MKIELDPDQERIVRERMASGEYRTADEVVAAALRLLDDGDEAGWSGADVEELRKKIAIGLEDIKHRRVTDGPAAFAAIRRRLDRVEATP